MLAVTDSQQPPLSCQPGDITVSKIHIGYLVGRCVTYDGPGPWCAYVALLETYEDAAFMGRQMARKHGQQVWLRVYGDDYIPLPDAEPQ